VRQDKTSVQVQDLAEEFDGPYQLLRQAMATEETATNSRHLVVPIDGSEVRCIAWNALNMS
jgi:hypothetical protein